MPRRRARPRNQPRPRNHTGDPDGYFAPPNYGFRVPGSGRAPLGPFVRGLDRRTWLRPVRLALVVFGVTLFVVRLLH